MADFSGLSVKFPLALDPNTGFYELNQTYSEMITQNLKNLILINPGERIMDPFFGVGVRTFLFQPNTNSTYRKIRERIHAQVERYMSFVRVNSVAFNNKDNPDVDHAFMAISIDFTILPLQSNRNLQINID